MITLIALFFTSSCISQNTSLDTKRSTLEWTGKSAFNAYSLTGTLDYKFCEIAIENDSIKYFKIVVDMKSLDHKNGQLKKHLRGKDFFEVNTYKEAIFIISEATDIKDGFATLKGNMTIKDSTNEETFIVEINEDYTEITFDIVLDRTLYGVDFNSPKEKAIADEFQLKGKLVLE